MLDILNDVWFNFDQYFILYYLILTPLRHKCLIFWIMFGLILTNIFYYTCQIQHSYGTKKVHLKIKATQMIFMFLIYVF
uniref:Uncharacterized protein n=1 Tax=Arundo donax TaxID=35708 RepID=A0A0A8ZWZ6_ARUDO